MLAAILIAICGEQTLTKQSCHRNAHFTPSTALSLFLYGKAGSGKSSFVRNFQPSLEATIEEHLDPAVLVRLVKQNLNKVRAL